MAKICRTTILVCKVESSDQYLSCGVPIKCCISGCFVHILRDYSSLTSLASNTNTPAPHSLACSSISGVFHTIASAWLFKPYQKALLPSWKFSELMPEVLLWKCSCCCLTTAVTAGPPIFHTLKVTLTKGMPGKVTVSSQQSLASPQCRKRWLLLSPNPSEVPADSPGNCTQGTKAKRDRCHVKAAAKGSLKWVPTERGSAEPWRTH